MRLLIAVCVCLAACGSGNGGDGEKKPRSMHADSRYDFLLSPEGTHDLYMAHRNDTAEQVALIRAALTEDARPRVRVNAIVALSASQQQRAMPAFVQALDDPDPAVVSEAALHVASGGRESVAHPTDQNAMAALRAHAAAIRGALASDSVRVRYNAATALAEIADPDVDLAKLLQDPDPLVRGVGLDLAVARASATNKLSAGDVAALDEVARKGPDAQFRTRAVNLIVYFAPAAAIPTATAAFTRGDVDKRTADGVVNGHLVALVPTIVAYLQRSPMDAYWIDALAALKATCASKAIASLLEHPIAGTYAERALKSLSGHGDWTHTQLTAWANGQAPCA